jgi:hypothetical protein
MSQKSDTGRSKLYGMTEYLMIAHEMEKARLLGRKARKNLRRSPRSPTRHRREHGVLGAMLRGRQREGKRLP